MRAAAFSPDGGTFAYVVFNFEVYSLVLVDVKSRRPFKQLNGYKNICFSPDSKQAAVSTDNGSYHIVLLDTETWEVQETLQGHRYPVAGM